MLRHLLIENIVLIEKLDLDFDSGLHVFTGETGAGKSILLDALGLALGARAEASLVRKDATEARVVAVFSPVPTAVSSMLAAQGLPEEDDLFLKRTLSQDGKSRAFINDRPVSLGGLRDIAAGLVDIHGQFDTHGLLDPAVHGGLLDQFGRLEQSVTKTNIAYTAWQETVTTLLALKQSEAERARDLAFLTDTLLEFETLAPQMGELASLDEARKHHQHHTKIAEGLTQALNALAEEASADNAQRKLTDAGKALARIVEKGPADIAAVLSRIDEALLTLQDIVGQLQNILTKIENGPSDMAALEDRLFALRALARKHRVTEDALPDYWQTLIKKQAALSDYDQSLSHAEKAATLAKENYVKIATILRQQRQEAAAKLEKAVTAELAPLKLEKARFAVELSPLPETAWRREGIDSITFLLSTNPGIAPTPLHKTASGGELARFMLALKVVMAGAGQISTYVFDEIDTGIGGATAAAVGEHLVRLSKKNQVLVITHSPQVAAKGLHHWHITKTHTGKKSFTSVTALADQARQQEIARMLSGAAVTDAAAKAAASLLAENMAMIVAEDIAHTDTPKQKRKR
jgi:DNA repair protein RecN (Recombination protein N)